MIISPKYDVFFKEIFRNETIRRYFIGDILEIPQKDIRSVELKNTFLWRRYRRQKLGILDIVIELNSQEKINIELQVKAVKNWDKRQLFYLSKLYTEELLVGQRYERLKRCGGISILDFNLSDRKEYHSVYRLRDKNGHEFSDILELHVIELNKELDGDGEVENWIRFFNAKTEEDLRMIKTKNPGIVEAMGELKRMSMSNPLKLMYEAYLKKIRDEKAREEYVWDQGKAEGIVEGKAEGILEGRAEGKEEGKAEGELLLAELMNHLLSDNRMEDAKLAASDEVARQRFYKEYGIE